MMEVSKRGVDSGVSKYSIILAQEGFFLEEYDVSGWNSADWRKYHAFIRSLRNTKVIFHHKIKETWSR